MNPPRATAPPILPPMIAPRWELSDCELDEVVASPVEVATGVLEDVEVVVDTEDGADDTLTAVGVGALVANAPIPFGTYDNTDRVAVGDVFLAA